MKNIGNNKSFIDKFTFQDRYDESLRILGKFPDRIPIICERSKYVKNCPDIDKHKYLVPCDITIGQFMQVIRKRIKLPSEDALFLFISNQIFSNSVTIGSIYEENKNKDGFLYVAYSRESTFG
jgi:GABA(A) receptor-associated protein